MEPRCINRTVDLSKPWPQSGLSWSQHLMLTGANLADRLELTVVNAGVPLVMDGLRAMAYFQVAEGDIVCECDISGAVVAVDFPHEAYVHEGALPLVIYLEGGEPRRSLPLYREVYTVGRGRGDVLIDPADIVPDMTAVLAALEDMRSATDNAIALGNMAVQVTSVAYGQGADGQLVQDAVGAYTLQLTLECGPDGQTGPRGATGPQGEPGRGLQILGVYADMTALTTAVPAPAQGDMYQIGTGAPYDLVMWDAVTNGWVDQGQISGAGGTVRSVNEITPDANGNVQLNGSNLRVSAADESTVAQSIADLQGRNVLTDDQVEKLAGVEAGATNTIVRHTLDSTESSAALSAAMGRWLALTKAEAVGQTAVLTTSGWAAGDNGGYVQRATVTGMSNDMLTIVAPDPSCFAEYVACMIYASSADTNGLTFSAESLPETDVTVNVVMIDAGGATQ